ncbi:MAG: radical SAM family heme chaperone HemW, partial [Verrucomicrobia bacterium]|nr:radical SAM family heme chaperone HemW [Verrucomicrobiota bacterium]
RFDHYVIRHVYVHIPFCPKICPYCSFYKEASDRNKTQAFLDAVLQELDLRLNQGLILRPETVFFGGGTPTALTAKQLEYLILGLRARIDFSDLDEWTIEMNPATVSLEKAQLLLRLGVTRASMGVQSWNPEILTRLGRVHSAEQAKSSYTLLREAGFTNINLDLIFGVPGQTVDVWHRTLEKTVSLNPQHISAYCLTYEEDTEFFRRFQEGELIQNTYQDASFFETTMAGLSQAGFQQYEISNYAKPGYECRHNLAYWLGRDYLGLGPSAFSTILTERWQNVSDTSRYIESTSPVAFSEYLSPETRKAESIAFGLRTYYGVPSQQIEPEQANTLIQEGYMERLENRLRLTTRGKMVADSIAELFV